MADLIDKELLKDPDFYKFWSKEVVRYGDLDPVGHANNAAYATYFETGRVDLLKDLKSQQDAEQNTAIVQLNISFMNELRLGDEIKIGISIGKIGTSSVEIYSALFRDNQCVATAFAVAVNFDMVKRRSLAFDAGLRALLEQYHHTPS